MAIVYEKGEVSGYEYISQRNKHLIWNWAALNTTIVLLCAVYACIVNCIYADTILRGKYNTKTIAL